MTDCCMNPRPEGMTAHTARCLMAQLPTTPTPRPVASAPPSVTHPDARRRESEGETL